MCNASSISLDVLDMRVRAEQHSPIQQCSKYEHEQRNHMQACLAHSLCHTAQNLCAGAIRVISNRVSADQGLLSPHRPPACESPCGSGRPRSSWAISSAPASPGCSRLCLPFRAPLRLWLFAAVRAISSGVCSFRFRVTRVCADGVVWFQFLKI